MNEEMQDLLPQECSRPSKQRSLVTSCLLASIGVHIAALFLFYEFQPSFLVKQSALNTEPLLIQQDEVLAFEENTNLDEIFNQIVFVNPHLQTLNDQKAIVYEGTSRSAEDESALALPIKSDFSNLVLVKEEDPSFIALRLQPAHTLPSLLTPENIPLQPTALVEDNNPLGNELVQGWTFSFESLAEDPIHTAPSGTPSRVSASLASRQNTEIPHLAADAAFTSRPQITTGTGATKAPLIPPGQMAISSKIARPNLPAFEAYAFPLEVTMQELETGMDLGVQVSPHPDGKGYLFSLTLVPHFDMGDAHVKQNFYFFIDRSNSIEKHRFTVFKKAVLRAITTLREGDTFNICVFDRKMVRLSEKNLPFSRKNLRLADSFLDEQESGGLFAAADLYKELSKLLPSTLSDGEVHSAFLLSDGNTLLGHSTQQRTLKNLIQQNDGRVALYTAAVGQDNNLALLDLLSSFSGGNLIYSETHTGFPRKLANKIHHMKWPIATNPHISVVSTDPKAKIALYASSKHLPALYSQEPYTILGSTDQLKDFTLYIQAKHKNQWITFRKEVSFAGAKQDASILEKKWISQEVKQHYNRFLDKGKADELAKAEDMLGKALVR
jgi:hypothetical protein